MTSFAREAIKKSFFRIAETKPIDKITVKDIVEDCGINRNSFYYHFEDLPCLIRVSIEEELRKQIFDRTDELSLQESIFLVIDFILEHKRACINIYHSKHRDLLERNFLSICQKAAANYFDRTLFQEFSVNEYDKKIIIYYYKTLFYGILCDWLNNNLNYDLKAYVKEILRLREDDAREMCINASRTRMKSKTAR